MAVRGILELYTQSNGWIEIELGDPSQLNYAPIEVETPNGWGAPNVVSPSDSDTPLEVYTQSNGWQGIKKTIYTLVDSWEDNDLSEYDQHETGTSMTASVLNASDAPRNEPAKDGDYVVKFGGDAAVGDDATIHSTSGDGLPAYPDRGENHGCYINPNELHNCFYFWAVGSHASKYPTAYSVRCLANGGSSPTFELWYEDADAGTTDVMASTSLDTTNYTNAWSEIRVEDGGAGNTISCYLYDENGTERASLVDINDSHSGTDVGVGFGGESETSSSSHTVVWMDFARTDLA